MNGALVCSCGCTYFKRVTRVSGPWVETLDVNGVTMDTDLDGLKHGPQPKTVSCEDCGKRQPNPHYKE